MNTDFQKILKRIAAENHTTPEEVYREMQIAIVAAYESTDPEVRKNWESISFKGDRPTPEDVIFSLGLMLSSGDDLEQ